MFEWQEFLEDVAGVGDGDYATAFKMLGFVLYVSRHGADTLHAGAMVSARTYYRWVETVKAAGWDWLLADVRFGQALREYVLGLDNDAAQVRAAVLGKLNGILNRDTNEGRREPDGAMVRV